MWTGQGGIWEAFAAVIPRQDWAIFKIKKEDQLSQGNKGNSSDIDGILMNRVIPSTRDHQIM